MQSQLIPANCWQWGRMSHAQAIAKKKIKKKKSPKVRMVLLAGSQEAFPTPLQGRGTWTGLLDALASPWTANTLSLSSTIPARAWTSLFLWFFVILAWIFCLQFSTYSFPPLPQNDAYGQDLSLPPPQFSISLSFYWSTCDPLTTFSTEQCYIFSMQYLTSLSMLFFLFGLLCLGEKNKFALMDVPLT